MQIFFCGNLSEHVTVNDVSNESVGQIAVILRVGNIDSM